MVSSITTRKIIVKYSKIYFLQYFFIVLSIICSLFKRWNYLRSRSWFEKYKNHKNLQVKWTQDSLSFVLLLKLQKHYHRKEMLTCFITTTYNMWIIPENIDTVQCTLYIKVLCTYQRTFCGQKKLVDLITLQSTYYMGWIFMF